ncbi:trans-sulfuration enzyme family protein [Rubrobacter aplysinae]|uniref:trans-sulfuration enzyme family protein n=1 Tax=Rubrobacter aplysinae TaxID=909625 RepID=UPI00069F4B57|nr:PLP-dependent aspartate aminotransferase family protein [Rubrobacter aplysinae]
MARFETRAVHAGEHRIGHAADGEAADGEAGGRGDFAPISTPIYASTTFSHHDMEQTDRILGGEEAGYSYARYDNPTVAALEEALRTLEDPEEERETAAFAFSSGMAAMHTALTAAEVGSGATVLAAEQLYGSTATLLLQIFGASGVDTKFVDVYDVEAVERAVAEHSPRALVIESISNPLLRVADVPRLAEAAHAGGAALIVDNTFGTPYLQRPLALGADIVVHSATKYLAGHGDVSAGAAAAVPPYAGAVEGVRKLTGGILGPFEAWLTLRGMKTLPLRMQRQCENAREISNRLTAVPGIVRVNHPALKGHPDAELAPEMLSDTGGLLSFELEGGREAAFRFLNALQLCVRAPSLGDVYTLITHPATSSHRELPASRRERLGVKEGLIRVSAGIEHPGDIAEDIEQALQKV